MTSYNAEVGTSYRGNPPEDLIDTLMDRLEPHHGSVGTLDGHLSLIFTYPADDLPQAIATGLAIGRQAMAGLDLVPTSLEVLPTDVFDRRFGLQPVPELLSVSEVAAELGVTPQAVRQRLDSGSISGVKAGATWVVPRGEVKRIREGALLREMADFLEGQLVQLKTAAQMHQESNTQQRGQLRDAQQIREALASGDPDRIRSQAVLCGFDSEKLHAR